MSEIEYFISILFYSIILSSCFSSSSSASEPANDACEPKQCGKINIRYPFWLQDQQPSYCGYEVFKVSCSSEGLAVLANSYGAYSDILEIFYENKSLVLNNTHILNSNCSFPKFNLSFDLTKLHISTVNRNLYFFYDCNASSLSWAPEYYKPPSCGFHVLLGGVYGGGLDDDDTPSEHCEYSKMPFLAPSDAKSSDYLEIIKNGYLLEWSVDDCLECKEDLCPSDESFPCICSNQPRFTSTCHKSDKSNKGVGRKIGIAIGAVVAAALLGGLLFLLYKRTKKRNRPLPQPILMTRSSSSGVPSSKSKFSKNDSELSISRYRTHVFTYEELEDATDGFSSSRELGDGGFGTVYKGTLGDGRVIAVKRLYENNFKRVEQFMNEVDILSGLHHPNLVILYGCTSRHSRELLLVYEYVPNGTVADHLHGPRATEQGLPLSIRLSIAIETADALRYLHGVEPQIIHRDVKTNNILLDNNFHVKVADFGLSRLFPINATHVSTAPQGTPGYVDPEYHMCYQLSDKSDVYSFGVVLAELISSLPAVDISRHRSDINLANMLLGKLQNNDLQQIVDPRLGYQTDMQVKKMIDMVVELAFRCLQAEKDMRPSIKQVLDALRDIESVGFGTKESSGGDEVVKQEACLLKNQPPYSPPSVIERWSSVGTTPSNSG